MTVYMMAMYDVADEQAHLDYAQAADAVLDKHEGRILAGTTQAQSLSGDSGHAGIVIAFPTHQAALDFYEDPEYQALTTLRETGTINTKIMLVDDQSAA